MEDLKIEYLEIGQLQPYERNAKKHDVDDVQAICRSIEQFGFSDPIGIWGKENLIVEGHGRLEAAKNLNLDRVPCIRLDELTDEERREYMIMHNRTAELSIWDFKVLAEEAQNEELYDFDVDLGLDDVNEEDFGDLFTLNDSEVPLQRTITMTLAPEQYEIAMAIVDYFAEQDQDELHTFGNENTKTNQFFEGVYLWAQQNNLL